jgi:hypothetical protein
MSEDARPGRKPTAGQAEAEARVQARILRMTPKARILLALALGKAQADLRGRAKRGRSRGDALEPLVVDAQAGLLD